MTKELTTAATLGKCTVARRYRINLKMIQELCERNYARLLEIAGEAICDAIGSTLLLPENHPDTRLTILEQTRYTTVISLQPETQKNLWDRLPRLVVRLYHDVRMAEVTAANQYRNLDIYYDYPNTHMHQPDEKHQINRLLTEWLRFC